MARGAAVSSGRGALALRLSGADFEEIADFLGYTSAAEARSAVHSALSAEQHDPDEREKLRTEESSRLLALLRKVWGKAMDPEDPEHLSSVKMALQIIDRHSRLHGLDAPQEVVVHNPTLSEIDSWVATVLDMGSSGGVVEFNPVAAIGPADE